MATLLEQIRNISIRAAEELREEGFITDADIRTLDRQDLRELLPDKGHLKVRKKIFQLISQLPPQSNTKHSIDDILKNIGGLIPPDSFENALSKQGPLLEYLWLLKEHRIPLREVQYSIEAQINFLERARGNSPVESNRQECATNSVFSVDPPMTCSPPEAANWSLYNVLNFLPKQQRQAHVMYKMVVSGKTLDMHLKVLEKLNGPIPGHTESLQLQETNDEDCQVVIVFCPVVSRAGTDVDAALREVRGDKPIILVAMHHMHSPSGLPPPRTNSKVVLGVNVFFHETANGLLRCSQNESALNDMKTKLHEYSKKRSCLNLKRGTKY